MPAIAHQNKILGDDIQSIHWSQAKTSVKKNLLPITLAELKSLNTTGTWNNNIYTLNGLTYTITTDRGYVSQISVSGTASAETHLQLGAWMKLGDLSYRFNGVSNTTTGIMWISSASGTYTLTSSVSEVSFTSHTSDDWAIYITYGNGTTPSGEVFKPMLRDASISDSTYVPYIKDNVELDADKADKTQITNPNLLDNPWFTINQRGQSSYGGGVYGYDRWLSSNNSSVTSDTNGIKIIGTVWQKFEPDFITKISGKTVTLSVLLGDGTIYSASGIAQNENATFITIDNDDIVARFMKDTYFTFIHVEAKDSAGLVIRAVKLELGSISTLVMDTAPNYATELLKCQRYFQRLCNVYGRTYAGIGTGIVANSTGCRLFAPLNAEFRTTPSVTFNDDSGKIMIVGADTSQRIAVTNVQLNQIGKNCIILTLTTASSSGTFTAGQSVECWFMNTTSAYIDFTADL